MESCRPSYQIQTLRPFSAIGFCGRFTWRESDLLSYRAIRSALFRFHPETAHSMTLAALGLLQRLPPLLRSVERRLAVTDQLLTQSLWGREFPNPVGLAAGYAKNGEGLAAMPALGFGFVEVGTVTPRSQPGNARPRLFRYPEQESLENALGFNNHGLEALSRQLADQWPARVPLGVNIGKNRSTPLEQAEEDYVTLLEGLSDRCDYFVINVSSPNTPGLRDLQETDRLASLIGRARKLSTRPMLVKLAPDLDERLAVELGQAVVDAGAAGLVLTNTTTDYSLLPGARRIGGLSGRALKERSYTLLRRVAAQLFGSCVLISVGGIDSADEAYRRLRAGATLVQIYTALVFQGPALVGRINRGLAERLDRDGFSRLSDAIGADR